MGHTGRMALVGAAMAMMGLGGGSVGGWEIPGTPKRKGAASSTGAEMAAKRKAWAKAKPPPPNASKQRKRRGKKGGG
jgi:hypothetical protein